MRYQRVILNLLIAWYLLLALGHYLNQRPLWNDEWCVLNSLVHLKPFDLFNQPLLSDQAFPRVYLFIIQQFSNIFHQSLKGPIASMSQNLLILRLPSLLIMLAAFFVWINIARRVLGNGWGMLCFVGCWAASMPLVYYAAELKPYSMDVLGCGLVVWYLLGQEQLLLFLPLLGFFSYAAIFLLLLPLYNLAQSSFKQKHIHPQLPAYLMGYVLMLIVVYLIDFRITTHHLLEIYWHDYFIALDSLKHFLNSFGKGMNNLISRPFAENPHWIKIPSRFFVGLGMGYMLLFFGGQFKKDGYFLRSAVSIAFALFVLQLMLAMARVYPLAVPRMALFFSPLLFIMLIKALEQLFQQFKIVGKSLFIIFALYLCFLSCGIAWDVYKNKDLGAESMLYNNFFF